MSDAGETCARVAESMCVVDSPATANAILNCHDLLVNVSTCQTALKKISRRTIDRDGLHSLVDAHGRKGRGIGAHVDEARAGE